MTGKRNRKRIAVIMGLCLVLMIGGVYAYFSESSSMNNPFTTPNPSVEIVENFNPADQWLPGEEKRKEVTFNNSGNVESLMRFKVEVWMTDPEGKEVESIPENFYTLNWSDNFNNSLGSGTVYPQNLATIGGKKLYFHFIVYKISQESSRHIIYTFYEDIK